MPAKIQADAKAMNGRVIEMSAEQRAVAIANWPQWQTNRPVNLGKFDHIYVFTVGNEPGALLFMAIGPCIKAMMPLSADLFLALITPPTG